MIKLMEQEGLIENGFHSLILIYVFNFIESGKDIKCIPSLTMSSALAVNDFLKSYGVKSNLKWPNDVLVKKNMWYFI